MPLKTKIIQSIVTKSNTCPFCYSTRLDADSPSFDDYDNSIKVRVICLDCRREWVEVYTVTTAMTVEDAEATDQCIFDEETCKSIDYRSVSGNRPDDYANIPCEYYEQCKKKAQTKPPLTSDGANNVLAFMLQANKRLNDRDFTLKLIINLLLSIDCPEDITNQILSHYNFEMVE